MSTGKPALESVSRRAIYRVFLRRRHEGAPPPTYRELTQATGLPHSTVGHHLGKLVAARLLVSDGGWASHRRVRLPRPTPPFPDCVVEVHEEPSRTVWSYDAETMWEEGRARLQNRRGGETRPGARRAAG